MSYLVISEDDRKALLENEKWVSDLLKSRSPEKPKPKPKPWWEKAGVVPAATAVLTVLVTSVAGYCTQKALRERENSFVEMQGRTQLARDAAKQANSAIASMLKVNEERLKFSRGELDFLNDSMRIAMARNTNRLQQDWRIQREDAGMALFLAFDSASGVPSAWQKTRDAIEAETICLEKAYVAHENDKVVPPCDQEIAARAMSATELRTTLKLGYDRARRLD